MAVDLVQNYNNVLGDSASRFIESGYDAGVLRPWKGYDGRSFIQRIVNGKPRVMVTNAPAVLTRDAWIEFDKAVVRVIRERLVAFSDIRNRGLVYNVPNAMGHTLLQYQTMGDIGRATVSMDPIRRSESDRPEVDEKFLPLPIVHKDFDFSARQIAVSRSGNIPLPVDTTTAEIAARKVADEIEIMTVGKEAAFTYGGGSVYGYLNLPERAIKTDMAIPNGSNGTSTIADVLALRQLLIDDKHFGPYTLYVNSQWSQYLDDDFSTAKGDQTLRQRILAIDGIESVRTLDHLPTTKNYMILVEMTSETVRAVIGMEVQTVQWESMGGLMRHFKVMALQVPQVRPDANGNSGVAIGSTS